MEQLRQSRLLPEDEAVQCVRRFGGDEPAHAIAAALIDQGVLTPFQAKLLSAGRAKELSLGQYRILDELGQGGMGRVYKALHTVMDRLVAIKVVSPEFAGDGRARGWFRREVLASTRLYHPNIVMAYDANEVDDALFLVMEYVDGSDLDSLVRRQGPLPISLACEMMRQAAQALQYAHEQGMVHRDIKPGNLLVPRGAVLPGAGETGSAQVLVKVVDFGLARLRGPAKAVSLLEDGQKGFLGSPDYVSPEQARDAHNADIRSDLYSLGCTLYFALTASKPFGGATVFETVVKHLEAEAVPLEVLRPEVPAGVAAVVRRLMAKEPAKRFQTPAELIAEMSFVCGPDAVRTPAAALPVPPSALVPVNAIEIRPAQGATNFIAELAFESHVRPPHPRRAETDTPVESLAEAAAAKPAPSPTVVSLPSPPPVTTEAAAAAVPAAEEEVPVNEPATTAADPRTCVDSGFRGAWREWVTVIEFLAEGGDPRRVSDPDYRALHGQLLAACRKHATEKGPARAFFGRMEAMIEPWLAPHAFAGADSNTLGCLLEGCRGVERELGWGGGARKGWLWLVLLVCLAGAAVAGWQIEPVRHWVERHLLSR